MSVLNSHQERREEKNQPISFFICLLGCLSLLGAAGRNPTIGTARQNTFWETSQFSTVIQRGPRAEALVLGVELRGKIRQKEKNHQSLRWEASNLWLAVKNSFLNGFVLCHPSTEIPNPSLSSPPCPLFVPVSPGSFQPLPILPGCGQVRGSMPAGSFWPCVSSVFIHFGETQHFGNLIPCLKRGWAWPWVQKGPQGTREAWASLPWESRLLQRGTAWVKKGKDVWEIPVWIKR